MERIGLEALLEQHVTTTGRRCTVAHARALGVLLRLIVVEREPIYRQQETVHGFASGLFGLNAEQLEHLSDDRLGRALDHLFQADYAALLTAVIVAVGRRFELQFQRLHNDSTSIGWSLVWVWSTLLTLQQQIRRHRNLAAATEALTSLRPRVLSARARLRGASRIDLAVEEILERYHMRRYLKVKHTVRQEHTLQTGSTRPAGCRHSSSASCHWP